MRRIILLVALPLCLAGARQARLRSCPARRSRIAPRWQRCSNGTGISTPPNASMSHGRTLSRRVWRRSGPPTARVRGARRTGSKSAWRSRTWTCSTNGRSNCAGSRPKTPAWSCRGRAANWNRRRPIRAGLSFGWRRRLFEFTTVEWRLIEVVQSSVVVASDDKRIKPYKAVVSAIGLDWRLSERSQASAPSSSFTQFRPASLAP